MTPAFIKRRVAEQFEEDGIGSTMTTKTQKEKEQQAIHAARVAAVHLQRTGALMPEYLTARKLVEAIQALDEPQPVSPEEAYLGMWFKFVDPGTRPECGVIVEVAERDAVADWFRKGWATSDRPITVYRFRSDDLIIPLQAEEE